VHQVDRSRAADPVVRTLPAEVGDDAGAADEWLRGSAVFVTTEVRHLARAHALGTPTVYVADGTDVEGDVAAALAGFEPDRLRIVRSGTPFRRDLPLLALHEAIEALAPGVLEHGLSESAKCRERLAGHFAGRIADLGHGGSKIVPHAVGVDFFKCDPWDHIGDVRDLAMFADGSFDTVYSSHCLEDLWHPEQALREWLRILRPGGRLVLYLPLRDFYPNVGTPGANPGHKDDYVPEDVVAFLARIGGVEVLAAERREAEDSFEVVAARTANPVSLPPAPEVSVLLIAERSHAGADVAADLVGTAAAVRAQLSDVAHEVLILLRERLQGDDRAMVFDLAARWPECRVVEDLRPHPFTERVRRLAAMARGEHLLAVQPGALPLAGALAALLARARSGREALLCPVLCDASGRALDHDAAPGSCVLLRRECLAGDAAAATPFLTPLWWNGLADDLEALGAGVAEVAEAVVYAPGPSARHPGAAGPVRLEFDRGLRRRGAAGTALLRMPEMGERVLLCVLKTLGDCVLALPVVDELAATHPDVRLSVLTETPYAWVFASHPAVAEVLTVPVAQVQPYTLQEDACLHDVLAARSFDRVVVLSDRLDNATYHHSGLDLRAFYAWQARLPAAAARRPHVHLAPAARARAERALAEQGVSGRYAVLHLQPGWPEKRPPDAVFAAAAAHLRAAGLTPVVVGGPGERLDAPGVVGLAGGLTQEESAAVIAGASVFCGGDSGPMHLAGAFDVPTLALYAGSGLRVAPPLSTRARAIQAPGSCAVACGVSPCREATACRDTLRPEHVLPRLDELLSAPAACGPREWLGDLPARFGVGPEGPVLQRLAAEADPSLLGTPGRAPAVTVAETPAASLPPRPMAARAAAAPVVPMPAVRPAAIADLLAEPPQPPAAAAEAGRLQHEIGRVLDVLPAADVLVVLRAEVRRALGSGRVETALLFLGVLIARAGELALGRRGRARPAYRPWLEQYLRAFLAPLVARRGFLPLLERCVAAFTEALSAAPDLDLVLDLLAAAPAGVGDGGSLPRLRALVAAAPIDDERRIGALVALGAVDEADALLSAMVAAEAAPNRRTVLLLRRGLLRAQAGRVAAAAADVEALQACLPAHGAGELEHVLARLRAWLARSGGATATVAAAVAAPPPVPALSGAGPC